MTAGTAPRRTALLGVLAGLALLLAGCSADEPNADGGGLAGLVDGAEPSDSTATSEEDPADDEPRDPSAQPLPDDDEAVAETADVEVAGELLPMQQSDPDGAIGRSAPELSGTDLDGDSMRIHDDGRPKIIGFFAHWCPHCQGEVPEVVDWLDAGGLPDDVDLYAVSTAVHEGRDNYPPSAWLADEGWTVPTMLDDEAGTAHLAYGAGNFPYWVVVGADGRVAATTSGTLDASGLDQLVDAAAAAAG